MVILQNGGVFCKIILMPRPLLKRMSAKNSPQSAPEDCTALYIRVSTDKQVKDGFGLDAQRSQLASYCAAQGWVICDPYIYVDAGISGKSTEGRDAFNAMMQAARNGEITRIVSLKIDRIARNLMNLLETIDALDKLNVSLVCIKEQFDTGNANGRFMLQVLGAVGELERSMIAERMESGRREKARQGGYNGSYGPFGYTFNNGKFEIDAQNAEIVNSIFNMFVIESLSLTAIAARLNASNTATRRGGKWRANTVRYILRNGFYAGLAQWGNIETSGMHQPIINIDTYEMAHDRLTSLKPGPQK